MQRGWKAWLHAPLAALLLAACVQNSTAPADAPTADEALRDAFTRVFGGPDEDDEFDDEDDGFWPFLPGTPR